MRFKRAALLTVLLVLGGMVAAAPAEAATKNHPSSDAPWFIGLAVLVVLALGLLMLRLRRGMSRRNDNGHFRS
jgi:hypothetical protein